MLLSLDNVRYLSIHSDVKSRNTQMELCSMLKPVSRAFHITTCLHHHSSFKALVVSSFSTAISSYAWTDHMYMSQEAQIPFPVSRTGNRGGDPKVHRVALSPQIYACCLFRHARRSFVAPRTFTRYDTYCLNTTLQLKHTIKELYYN